MKNYKIIRKERANRRTALLLSLIFHLGLLGGIAYASTGSDWKSLVPESIKEYLQLETTPPAKTKDQVQA